MAELDRARSFIERYVVARAASFRMGQEQEDGWKATLDAKSIYRHIAQVSKDAEPVDLAATPPGQLQGASSFHPHGNPTQGVMAGPKPGTVVRTKVPPPGSYSTYKPEQIGVFQMPDGPVSIPISGQPGSKSFGEKLSKIMRWCLSHYHTIPSVLHVQAQEHLNKGGTLGP